MNGPTKIRRRGARLAAMLGLCALAWVPVLGGCAERMAVIPAPQLDESASGKTPHASETVVLSGGCFWGVQAVFQHLKGVQQAVSGYAGGARDTAEYEQVSTGTTGHAESVRVTFDPAQVSFGTILRIFFSVAHDPTQVDRQGPDTGTQYRSAIFTLDDEQRRIAQSYVRQLDQSGVFGARIATRIDALQGFYPAEDYHQDFATRHPEHAYIVFNDLPKLRALERLYPQQYRAQPSLVFASNAGTQSRSAH